jgi:hypothetical protein
MKRSASVLLVMFLYVCCGAAYRFWYYILPLLCIVLTGILRIHSKNLVSNVVSHVLSHVVSHVVSHVISHVVSHLVVRVSSLTATVCNIGCNAVYSVNVAL